MKPELIVIDSINGLLDLKQYLSQSGEYCAFDTETTGLTRFDRIIGFSVCLDEFKAVYVILEKFENGILNPMPYLNEARDLILSLKDKQLIMHNAVYDCMIVNSYLKIDLMPAVHTDTMVLAHLLDENRRVGLKELASTIFGENSKTQSEEMKAAVVANGGKLTKLHYEMWKCDSYIMGRYGAQDALLTYRLFTHLVPVLFEQGLDKFFYEEESMPLLRGPTYDLNTTGIQVDTKGLLELKKTLEAECAELKHSIYNEIHNKIRQRYPGTTKADTFNIGAPQQLSWLLFSEYNLEFGNLTAGGKTACRALGIDRLPYSFKAKKEFIHACMNSKDKKLQNPWKFMACDKKLLTKYADKYKWIKYLLEYSKKMKLLNTYVKGIEERIQYGLIQPSFLQTGTSSGRYSSRNPNFQNLPRDDKRIKSIIVSRSGRHFVGADYSQLEPRVFASLSGDERLCAAFDGRSDFYSVVGIGVYSKPECLPLKDGHPSAFGVLYPKLRQDAKTFTLASTYGATGYQLAPMMGKSPDEAQQDIEAYFEEFPKVREMMKESHKLAKSQGYVTNIFGRPRRIPEAKKIDSIYRNAELPYEARSLLNLAVNHRIQSTAASIVNRSAIKLYNYLKQANIEAKFVLQVHDSLVIECDESAAESVALLMRDAMENTVALSGVSLEAVPKIGKNLSEV